MNIEGGAGKPLKARVLERLEGGGAVVEVPVIMETAELDLRMTEGGGKSVVSVTMEHLREMAANFPKWHRSVTVGFDGIDPGHRRDKGGPSMAHVLSVRLAGNVLWATTKLSSAVADLIVGGSYRATSMEAAKDPKTAIASFTGWVLTGFVFTNQNSTDTLFDIAASGVVDSSEMGTTTVQFDKPEGREADKELAMADTITAASGEADKTESVSLTFHEEKLSTVKAELDTAEGQVRTLKESTETLREQVRNLRGEADTAKTDAATAREDAATDQASANRALSEAKRLREENREANVKLTEATEKLNEQADASLSLKVTNARDEFIRLGVKPALFDGLDSNPVEWLNAKFVGFDAFNDHYRLLCDGVTVPSDAKANSGHDPSSDSDPSEEMDLTTATTEADARKIIEARKANKAAE